MSATAIAAAPVATCAGAAFLPDHLSWSGIPTYSQCPRKYHYRYIVQAPVEFTPASLAFGGAFHRAAERLHQARHQRNLQRRQERARRIAAREEAENEVVDRDFTCEDDCDSFLDHINDRYHDAFDPNTAALKRRWEEFLAARGEKDFPPLISNRR